MFMRQPAPIQEQHFTSKVLSTGLGAIPTSTGDPLTLRKSNCPLNMILCASETLVFNYSCVANETLSIMESSRTRGNKKQGSGQNEIMSTRLYFPLCTDSEFLSLNSSDSSYEKHFFFLFFLIVCVCLLSNMKKITVIEEGRKLLRSVISVYVKLLYKQFLVGSTRLCVFWHKTESASA